MTDLIRKALIALLAIAFVLSTQNIFAHGVIESPASRTQFCGVITKPHHTGADAVYDECAQAFAGTAEQGYNFMSVLTHTKGRADVETLPNNVCGFNSESFNNGKTVWDAAIDWPTNNMQAGRNKISWNIEWGPHFSDTEEFSYWITKSDYVFQVGVPLTWNDFEEQPFCSLTYDDTNPSANPDIVADVDDTRFDTYCDVPERTGRHVIYGEWGRNQYTYERFHSCIDARFSGENTAATTRAVIEAENGITQVSGNGSIAFTAENSIGDSLSYNWQVEAPDLTLYQLSSANTVNTTLTLAETDNNVDVNVLLTVSNSEGQNTTRYQIEHLPFNASAWTSHGTLFESVNTLTVGDSVSIRVVDGAGNDKYYPEEPLLITSDNQNADQWPIALAMKINEMRNAIQIGVLDDNNAVMIANNVTENVVYSTTDSNIVSAFLHMGPYPTQDEPSNEDNTAETSSGSFDLYFLLLLILLCGYQQYLYRISRVRTEQR